MSLGKQSSTCRASTLQPLPERNRFIRRTFRTLDLGDRAVHAERGPAFAGPLSMMRSTVGLNEGRDAVAMRNDLAARDPRRVRNQRVEVLIADPIRHQCLGLVGLLCGLEETKRTQDAVAGLNQVVAGEAREAGGRAS